MSRVDPIPALKAQLGAEIARLVTGWNGDDIAYVIGTDRARISELRRGKLARFSLETLIRYLTRLRQRVEISVIGAPALVRNGSRTSGRKIPSTK